MPQTYEPIATTTLGSTSATINFTSIPASYTDLRVVLTCTSTSGSAIRYRFNSDTATNYSFLTMYANATSVQASQASSQTDIYLAGWAFSPSATVPAFYAIDIFNYASSSFKTTLHTTQANYPGGGILERVAGIYRSTSAITAVNLFAGTSFGVGTTATLYGILKA
jgi:hypothetical protein